MIVDETAVDEFDEKLDGSFVSTVEPGEHRMEGYNVFLERRNIVHFDQNFGNTDMRVIMLVFGKWGMVC